MYIALAYFNNPWTGDQFEQVKEYVDRKNNSDIPNKYCILELNEMDTILYKKLKRLDGAKPTVVYDPYGVSPSLLKAHTQEQRITKHIGKHKILE